MPEKIADVHTKKRLWVFLTEKSHPLIFFFVLLCTCLYFLPSVYKAYLLCDNFLQNCTQIEVVEINSKYHHIQF